MPWENLGKNPHPILQMAVSDCHQAIQATLNRESSDLSGDVVLVAESYGAFLAASLAAKYPGTNCIKIGLPGKLILSKRKGLREVLFS